MKFTSFNRETLGSHTRESKPTINLSLGASTINKHAVEILGFKNGDKISIHQDDENDNDFFISLDPNGFELRECNKDKAGKYTRLGFNNTKLAKLLLKAYGREGDKSISFQIKMEPNKIVVPWQKTKADFYLLCLLPRKTE